MNNTITHEVVCLFLFFFFKNRIPNKLVTYYLFFQTDNKCLGGKKFQLNKLNGEFE